MKIRPEHFQFEVLSRSNAWLGPRRVLQVLKIWDTMVGSGIHKVRRGSHSKISLPVMFRVGGTTLCIKDGGHLGRICWCGSGQW